MSISASAAAVSQATPGQATTSAAHPVRVLLLDDSPLVHARVKNAFRGTHVGVTATDYWFDVQKRIFSESPPDLLVLDLQMPAIDGRSVCRAIKRRVSIPVVLFSSENAQTLQEAVEQSGADAALSKECPDRELVDTIQRIAKRHAK